MSSVKSVARASVCPVCQARNTRVYDVSYSTFRHLDFAEQKTSPSYPNIICACDTCGVIYRIDRWTDDSLSAQFTTDEYAAHKEDHQVRDQQGDLRAAAEVQADLIVQRVEGLSSRSAVLDIGCFDGKLLQAIQDRTGAGRCTGYDVASREDFPDGPGFEFLTDGLDRIEGHYDLILMSHSLIYIEDVKGLFERLAGWLADGAHVFVHVPNVDVRPSSVLLGDQLYYFGREALVHLLHRYGFSVSFIGQDLFPKDLLLVAKKDQEVGDVSDVQTQRGESSHPVMEALEQLEIAILAAVEGQESVSVLGTTIEAAFVNSLIPDKVTCFVDENPSKQHRPFGNKPVISPSELVEGDTCLIPMGKQARSLAERLSRKSPARFVAV